MFQSFLDIQVNWDILSFQKHGKGKQKLQANKVNSTYSLIYDLIVHDHVEDWVLIWVLIWASLQSQLRNTMGLSWVLPFVQIVWGPVYLNLASLHITFHHPVKTLVRNLLVLHQTIFFGFSIFQEASAVPLDPHSDLRYYLLGCFLEDLFLLTFSWPQKEQPKSWALPYFLNPSRVLPSQRVYPLAFTP